MDLYFGLFWQRFDPCLFFQQNLNVLLLKLKQFVYSENNEVFSYDLFAISIGSDENMSCELDGFVF